ncbi:MAG: cell surface protein [Lactococcus sp.]
MKKITLCVIFLISLLSMAVPQVSADESNYETHGSVGFTGTWTTPSSSSTEPSKNYSLPSTQQVLPKTGSDTIQSNLMTFSGLILLFFITLSMKKWRTKNNKI